MAAAAPQAVPSRMQLLESEKSCVPYARRPEWADVSPLPPPPGDAGKVVAIQYSERHAEALAYFRAVLAKGEKSARALDLTRHLIAFNSADYTAWEWRWECVVALGGDLAEESALTERVSRESAKNYQLWNHRSKVAAARGPAGADEELAFAAGALDADEKNYHAWAHRQGVVAAFGLWEGELRYSEAMVERDVRNNSAWAQRAFVQLALLARDAEARAADLPTSTAATSACRAAYLTLLQGEFEYVAGALALDPRNESAWNYLLGLFTLPGATPHEMGRHMSVYIICKEALLDCPSCAPALDALAAWYVALACLLRDAASASAGGAASGPALARARDAASKALAVLSKAAVADPMRRPYLGHRRYEARQLLQQLAAGG